MLIEQVVKAAQIAFKSIQETQIYFHEGHYHDIGTNRNLKETPFDDALAVLEFVQANGDHALLFSYACHPTILHEDHTCYSCDLLGPVFRELEQDVEVAMFYNGACGDISTRFTKRASKVEEVERLGALLVEHIQEVRSYQQSIIAMLQTASFTIEAKTRSYASDEDIIAKYHDTAFNENQQNLLDLYRHMRSYCEGMTLHIEIRLLQLGSIWYVYVPVELFSKLSLRLKQQLPQQHIVCVSYAMDYLSYLPDADAYQEEPIGFEAVISPFPQGFGEVLIDQIAVWIRQRV